MAKGPIGTLEEGNDPRLSQRDPVADTIEGPKEEHLGEMADGTPKPASGTNGVDATRDGAGSKAFLKPRLTGARFEGHAIPLEFLKDLAVLEEMVIEVAKWRFLKANPERKRSPRGFTDGVELKLTGVEEGSAIPVISLVMASATLFPPENQAYFEEARESIVAAIGAAEQNGAIASHLPETALGYFDRMGRGLRDGEAIEFTTPKQNTPVKLTRESRRRLVLASSQVELTEEQTIRGIIPEADQEAWSFHIQLVDGRKIPAPMREPHLQTIKDAFVGYKEGVRVQLQGVVKLNRGGKLQSIESVEHVSILDPMDVAARLDELRILKDGWLDGAGVAPSSNGVDWLTAAFREHYPEDLPPPFLYPTVDGGVRAEWSIGPNELSVEISLNQRIGGWHALQLDTGADEARSLNLDLAADWKWVVDRVRVIAGEKA